MIWNANPIAFSVLNIDIRWYGLVYALGFFFCDWFGWKHISKLNIVNKKQWENCILGTFIIGVIGGRIGEFIFYSPSTFVTEPLEILKIWNGGMSIHGGVIASILWILFWSKKHKLSPLVFTDAIVLPLAIVLIFGRLANWANGELWGRPTGTDWGVIFPHVDSVLRHPSQLYESGKNLLLSGILLAISRLSLCQKEGIQTVVFFAGYGILRFIIEFYREPTTWLGSITTGQALCAGMVLFSIILAWSKNFWKK